MSLRSQTASGTTSKKGVLPPIGKNSGLTREMEEEDRQANPFILPAASEIFTLREKERLKQRQDRAKERTLQVHEKMTFSTRMNAKLSSLRKQVVTPEEDKAAVNRELSMHEATQFLLATTKERHLEKEDLPSYIGRKREMFLVQYALGVKRDEIKKLEDIAKAEEKKLEAAEKYLEQSATMFDEFLKENDKNAVEAIKMAEAAAKAKLEKVADIKKLNAQLIATKNEISRNAELIRELMKYKMFLDNLAPRKWRKRWSLMKAKSQGSSVEYSDNTTVTSWTSSKEEEEEEEEEDKEEEEEEEEDQEINKLYFKHPSQLMNIFTELEEQNLSLIQNSQETEVTLEEIKQSRQAVEEKMNHETENLLKQIEILKSAIAREEEKAYELEIKSNEVLKLMYTPIFHVSQYHHHHHTYTHQYDRMYSYGEYKAEDQEQMLQDLDKKVSEVYTRCIGANDANITTLQMLASIENRMEELFETIESLPADKIEAAEKAKEKERRIRQREEKLEEQRRAQEERLRRALERAQADPKKRVGRKLVYRSEPPVMKKKQEIKDEDREREEEELRYFFS